MPWQETSTMSLRQEFIELAMREKANRRELCRRFSITPKTCYKWLHRYQAEGLAGLADRSRRPRTCPKRTRHVIEQRVVRVRQAHKAWGGRTIAAHLVQRGVAAVPNPRTVHNILKRYGLIDPDQAAAHRPTQRFEHPTPNDLWQMDFKGHFAIGTGRCHPLTILDDHSRFIVLLHACTDETAATVRPLLIESFHRYGLPHRMLMDNGGPWGSDRDHPYTPLTVWLIRLGIRVCHGRPYHPQTQGKTERFHRTLKAELLTGRTFTDLIDCQLHLDRFRCLYNGQRPHQALEMAVPLSRYEPSPRTYPETLPPIEYAPDDIVRKVQVDGTIYLHGGQHKIGKAFHRHPIALRPTNTDGLYNVIFCQQTIKQLDLR